MTDQAIHRYANLRLNPGFVVKIDSIIWTFSNPGHLSVTLFYLEYHFQSSEFYSFTSDFIVPRSITFSPMGGLHDESVVIPAKQSTRIFLDEESTRILSSMLTDKDVAAIVEHKILRSRQ